MHKIYGIKENKQYQTRKGVYIIPIKDNKIAVVKIPKGYFLIGGGIEENESDIQCITREVKEEIGYSVKIIKKVFSAEAYLNHNQLGYIHLHQTYYIGELLNKEYEQVEKDHELVWIEYPLIKNKMYVEIQNYAVDYIEKYIKK